MLRYRACKSVLQYQEEAHRHPDHLPRGPPPFAASPHRARTHFPDARGTPVDTSVFLVKSLTFSLELFLLLSAHLPAPACIPLQTTDREKCSEHLRPFAQLPDLLLPVRGTETHLSEPMSQVTQKEHHCSAFACLLDPTSF